MTYHFKLCFDCVKHFPLLPARPHAFKNISYEFALVSSRAIRGDGPEAHRGEGYYLAAQILSRELL